MLDTQFFNHNFQLFGTFQMEFARQVPMAIHKQCF